MASETQTFRQFLKGYELHHEILVINLLGQALVLQSRCREESPTQTAPPKTDLRQMRLLVCLPVPQVTGQGVQKDHKLQPPETTVLHCIDEIQA